MSISSSLPLPEPSEKPVSDSRPIQTKPADELPTKDEIQNAPTGEMITGAGANKREHSIKDLTKPVSSVGNRIKEMMRSNPELTSRLAEQALNSVTHALGLVFLGLAALTLAVVFPPAAPFVGGFLLGGANQAAKNIPGQCSKFLNNKDVQEGTKKLATVAAESLKGSLSKGTVSALENAWDKLSLKATDEKGKSEELAHAQGKGTKEEQIETLKNLMGMEKNKELQPKILHALAELDDPESQYKWGMLGFTQNVKGDQPDKASALEYLNKSANQGHLNALLKLGDLYRSGEAGSSKDTLKAVECYSEVAAKADTKPEEYKQALKGLNSIVTDKKPGQTGRSEALLALVDIYSKDISKYEKELTEIAEKKENGKAFVLANLVLGKYSAAQPERRQDAKKRLNEAAKLGSPEASYQLYKLLGEERSDLLKTAAEGGYQQAELAYGIKEKKQNFLLRAANGQDKNIANEARYELAKKRGLTNNADLNQFLIILGNNPSEDIEEKISNYLEEQNPKEGSERANLLGQIQAKLDSKDVKFSSIEEQEGDEGPLDEPFINQAIPSGEKSSATTRGDLKGKVDFGLFKED